MSILVTHEPHFPLDQLEIRFHATGPIELDALGECSVALSQAFDRHLKLDSLSENQPPIKLFITKIDQGSIVATIAPFVSLMTEPLAWMAATNTVKTFSGSIISLLKQFSGDEKSTTVASAETSKTIQAFLKPLTGRNGSELGITHARYEEVNGDKKIVCEYKMETPQINIAANNSSKIIEAQALIDTPKTRHVIMHEVTMKLAQMNEMPGKEKGRTGDRAIIPDVSDRDLPLYFHKQSNEYKMQILERTENPFQKYYVVDVDVEYSGDTPAFYRLIQLHQVFDA